MLLAGVGGALVVVLVSRGGDDPHEQAQEISASLERPLQRLDDAVQDASPRQPASMVALRAAAERAVEELDDADNQIQALDSDTQGDPAMRALEDGVDASRELAEALVRPRLSDSEIEGLSVDTRATLEDLTAAELPEVDTDGLVSALRTEQRRRAQRRRQQQDTDLDQVAPETEPPTPRVPAPSYRQHAAFGYQAQIPTGTGWSEPADSQPNPSLFRTNVRGPAGMFVIVDYTPDDAPAFGGGYKSSREVGQTAFGSATEYIFQGGALPECQRSPCVDYFINDPASPNSGFAVLAGGSDFELAQDIGRTVMESVVPQSYGE